MSILDFPSPAKTYRNTQRGSLVIERCYRLETPQILLIALLEPCVTDARAECSLAFEGSWRGFKGNLVSVPTCEEEVCSSPFQAAV